MRWCAGAVAPPAHPRHGPCARRGRPRDLAQRARRLARRRLDDPEPGPRSGRVRAGGVRRGLLDAAAAEWFRRDPGGRRRGVVRRRAQQPGRRVAGPLHARPDRLRGVPGTRRARRAGLPDGRVGGRLARAGLGLAYASTVLALGLLPALAFDPAAQGCAECPRQSRGRGELLLVRRGGEPSRARARPRLDAAARPPLRSRRSAVVLRRPAPEGARAAGGRRLPRARGGRLRPRLERGFLSNDRVDRDLWLAQAAALSLLVLGVGRRVGAGHAGAHEGRAAGHRAGDAPAVGGLRDALAERSTTGARARLSARRRSPCRRPGRPVRCPRRRAARSRRRARRRPVAVVVHRAGCSTTRAVRGRERGGAPRARARTPAGAGAAQLEELRASRAGPSRPATPSGGGSSATSTTAPSSGSWRSRSRSGCCAAGRRRAAEQVDAATERSRRAIAELRELARGIYPRCSRTRGSRRRRGARRGSARAGAGRAAAGERCPPAVEAAAYFLVAEIAQRGQRVQVRAHRRTAGCSSRSTGRGWATTRRPRGPRRRPRRRAHRRCHHLRAELPCAS